MQSKKKVVTLLAGGVATLALAGGGLKVWAEQGGKGEAGEVEITLTASQLKAATAAALAVKQGKVLETEAESEGGKTHCDVQILAADGKTYEVGVDVASHKVASVEADNNKDDHDDGKNDDHDGETNDDAGGVDKD